MKELLRNAKELLAAKEINPVDAELLLAHAAHVTRMDLHSKAIEFTPQIREDFQGFIKERIEGRPTQYIIGEAAFRYLELEVGEGVLIPRPETELLVDEVLHNLNKFDETVSIVDLGSGSGAIAIALQTETAGKVKVATIAVENSKAALPWLHKNIAKYDLPIRVIEESVETALEGIKCDVVVANPPYIPDADVLPDEVLREPDAALFGGPDGMQVPQLFIRAAERMLKSGGFLAIEHHELQGELIAQTLANTFTNIRLHVDLNDRPRFTTAVRK
jgi:release factor glutamine methyltransferase